MNGRKVKVWNLDVADLVEFMKHLNTGRRGHCVGIPPDARVVQVAVSTTHPHRLCIIMESDHWHPLHSSEMPQWLNVDMGPYAQLQPARDGEFHLTWPEKAEAST